MRVVGVHNGVSVRENFANEIPPARDLVRWGYPLHTRLLPIFYIEKSVLIHTAAVVTHAFI